jgi:hypothetical protein
MSPNELEELAHVVGNPESWRKEVQKDGLFTKRASIERVMEIPKSPPTAPTYHGRLLDFIPYELTGVITESQCIDLLTLKHDLRYDDDRANVVIRKAWSFWSRAQGGHGGSMQEIPLREILVTLIPGSSSPRVENENQVLRINVAHLIWRWDRGTGSEGQVADERISFVVFLRFIVRYWSFEDPQDIVIRDIAARGPNAGNPQWKDWFLPPPADVWAAKVRMADRREKRIYVVESKDPKAFQVLTWHDSRETPLVGNVIHHPDRNERFEVVFPGGQATSGATLSEVLSRSLEFCVPWRWHLQVDPTAVAQTAAVDPAEGRVEVPVAFDDPGDEESWCWF